MEPATHVVVDGRTGRAGALRQGRPHAVGADSGTSDHAPQVEGVVPVDNPPSTLP